MAQLLPSGSVHVAVDGGAYRGTSTETLLSLFPGCIVHAFEPQQASFAKLQERLGGRANIRLFQQALSNQPGEALFQVNEKAFTSSLLATNVPGQMKPAGEERVDVTTLDAWSEKEGVVPDIIKLDLQGAELMALRGAANTLRNGVKAVLVEVNFERRYQGACLYFEVAALLAEHGFGLHRMYEIVSRPDGQWVHADALFIRR